MNWNQRKPVMDKKARRQKAIENGILERWKDIIRYMMDSSGETDHLQWIDGLLNEIGKFVAFLQFFENGKHDHEITLSGEMVIVVWSREDMKDYKQLSFKTWRQCWTQVVSRLAIVSELNYSRYLQKVFDLTRSHMRLLGRV